MKGNRIFPMEKLVCIVGPTASGKTALSISLAQELSSEIVSSDSMQIYRRMNIGTAKPDKAEQAGIPHHMLDIIDPSEEYSAARYSEEASAAIADIRSRGHLPIVVGGTGYYVNALLGRITFEPEPDNTEVRARLTKEAETLGEQVLYDRLSALDPVYAATVHPNNVKRVIRALEIMELSGGTVSERASRIHAAPLRYEPVFIGICPESRELLVQRIEKRVDLMLKAGLLEEARQLYGENLSLTARQAIGYKELFSYFDGNCTLEEARESIRIHTRQYSKRQMTWFRQDKDIHWITYPENVNFGLILEKARDILREADII